MVMGLLASRVRGARRDDVGGEQIKPIGGRRCRSATRKFVNESLDQLVSLTVKNHTPEELALGWLRYEAVRKMSARHFGEMCKRNLGGEFFDDMVTEAVKDWDLARRFGVS